MIMRLYFLLISIILGLLLPLQSQSQNLVSQDYNNPSVVDNITNEQVFIFNHQTESTLSPASIARDYQYKDFYLKFTQSFNDDFVININFQQATYAGIALYRTLNGEMQEVCVSQNKSKNHTLYVPIENVVIGEEFLIRLWVNETVSAGVFSCQILPITRSTEKTGGSPPIINTTSFTPQELVEEILTTGCVEALNIEYTGNPNSIAYFSSGIPGLDFEEGIILCSGYASEMAGPNNTPNQTGSMGVPGDSDLNDVIGGQTRDASVLEFDFIPANDHVEFQYVFGSEEYEEYVGSNFNDVFAFFISGGPENYDNLNIALIPGTTTPVSINNVNQNINTAYYLNNDNGAYLQLDGTTTTLVAQVDVTACETYHMKLAIADVSDRAYDSGVFLKAGSFVSGTSVVMKNFNAWGYLNSIHEGCTNQLIFSRSDTSNINEAMDVDITISGSADMNTDYTSISTHYEIPIGEEYIEIDYDAIADFIDDDDEYIVISIYNGCPCSVQISTDSIRIDDQIEFNSNITNNGPVCYGDSVLLQVNMSPIPDTAIIQWSNGMTGSEIYVSPTEETTYSLTIDYPCSSKLLSTTVEVWPLPIPVASNSGPYCEGDDIELYVNDASFYRWKGPNGFLTTTQNPIVSEAGIIYSGNYLVTVTDENGCKASTNTVVVVNANPIPDINGPFNYCEGETISLNAGTYNEYQWSGPDGFSSTLENPQINPVVVNNSGLYQVLVVDDNLCRGTDTATFFVYPIPNAEITINSPVCEGDTVFLGVSEGSAFVWTGPNGFNSLAAYPTIINSTVEDAGTYYVTVSDNGCSNNDSAVLVVDSMPDATITLLPVMCELHDPITLQAISSGGLWSGNGIEDATAGIFNPESAGNGSHTIYYNIQNGECSDNDSIDITLDEAIDPEILPVEPFCVSDAASNLLSVNVGGVWSGDGITDAILGTFDALVATPGSHTIYYTTTNGTCILTDSVVIQVYDDVDASITPVGDFCENDTPYTLEASSSGGTWSGNGITNTSLGIFDPATASSGSHYIYYEVGNGSCYDIDSVLIQVDAIPDASILASGPFCETNATVTLFAATLGGTWSGTGITDETNGVFDPSIASPGSHLITYTITGGACLSFGETTIDVYEIVDASIVPQSPICTEDNPITLNAASSGGEWSGSGIIDSDNGIFDPSISGPGDYTITYEVNNGPCTDTDQIIISVDYVPDASVFEAGPFCITQSATTLTSATAGGIWTGNGITDAALGIFDPNSAGVGTHTITYSLTNGTCNSSDQIQIIVYADVDASIAPAGPFCITYAGELLSSVSSGGTWSGDGITDINTGFFSPSAAGVGNHTIEYSIENGTCTDMQSIVIHVDAYPNVSASDAGPFCETESPVNLSGSPAGGTWSGTGITNPTGGVFSPSNSGYGSFDITYSVTNGACIASDNIIIVVDENKIPIITADGPWCEDNTIVPLQANYPNGTWSGTGIINTTTGIFDPQISGCGDFTISYELINGECSNTDNQDFHVDCIPDASIQAVSDLCETDASVTLIPNTPPAGTWSGVGVSGNNFDPNLAGPGNHIVYNTVQSGVCERTDSITIHVDEAVDASITASGPYCQTGVATNLSAVSSGGVWSGSGIVNASTGLFDPFIAGVGSHTITYDVTNGACSDSDTEIFIVEEQPDATITQVGPFCASHPSVNIPAASTGGIWTGTGITDATNGVFDPSVAGAGNHLISYAIVNGSCSDNDQITIHIDEIVDATINPVGPFCVNNPAVTLTSISSGGTWSGPGIVNANTGLFDPAFSGAGIHTIQYQVSNGECNDSDTEIIVVDNETAPVITPVGTICESSGTITLNGSPVGGIWSGTGITNTTIGTFDPAISSDGIFNITYTVSNGACTNNTNIDIQVDASVDASISSAGPYCQFDDPVFLVAVSTGGNWSGTGITDNSTGEFTPEIAGVGLHTITYSIVNGTCNDTDTENIQVDAALDAGINDPSPYCITDPPSVLSSVTPGGTWSGIGITNNTTGMFDPIVAGAGAHTITYTLSNGSCTSVETVLVYVYNTVVDATITSVATQCVNNVEIILTAATAGGTWSGIGIIDASAGTFDPGVAGAGTHTINYAVGNIACYDAASTNIQVDDTLPASINPAGPYCSNHASVNLTAASVGGTWSGSGITDASAGIFDPSIGGGDYTITYSVNSGVCTNSGETEIHIDDAVDASITPDGPFCIEQASVSLQAVSSGGTWSGTGISNTSTGTFSPALAGAGIHAITYLVVNGVCNDSDTETFQVDAVPNTDISSAGPYCESASPVNLNATTPGGTWSGTGITDASAGIFDPNNAGMGTHNIIYTLTVGACTSSSSTDILVDEAVDATITPAGPFCEIESSVTLQAGSMGGTWSGTGIIDASAGTFHPSVAGGGTHSINYTVSNGSCSDNDIISIVVYSNPQPIISAAGPYCESQTPISLNVNVPGGTWSGNGIVDVNAGVFDPQIAQDGDHQITYTVGNGTCLAETSITIQVDEALDATISPAGPFCETSGTINILATDFGGTWSGTGIIDANNGTFDPDLANPGNHTITYTIVNGVCSDTDTEVVHVDFNPDASISGTYTYCENDADEILTTVTSGGTWGGTGIQDVFTGLFSPSIAQEGIHEITYTLYNGACTAQDFTSIEVSASVDATITPAGPFCESQSPLNLTAVSNGGVWSGTGIIDNDNGLFSPAVAQPGNHTITYNVVNGYCSDTDTEIIEVNNFPDATITSASAYCIADGEVILTATTPGGIWSGLGITDANTGLFDPVIAGVGSTNIVYNINNGACSASDNQLIFVDEAVDATISETGPYCENEVSVTLTAASSGGVWSGTGITNVNEGTFSPQNTQQGTFTVQYDVQNGSCVDSDTYDIVVDEYPDASITAPSTICMNESPVNLMTNTSGGIWSGTGITDDVNGIFNPMVAGAGIHTITYSVTNGTCVATAQEEIQVFEIPYLEFISIDTTMCLNEPSQEIIINTPGGVFSGDGMLSNVFRPSTAGAGIHEVTYTLTNAQSCTNSISQNIEVFSLTDTQFSGLSSNYCLNDNSAELIGTPTGGIFEGDGLTENIFNPEDAGIGTHEILYHFTDDNMCTDTAYMSVNVNSIPDIIFDSINYPSCSGEANGSIYISINGGTPGYIYMWTGESSSFNQDITNLQSGQYYISVNDALGCSDLDTVSLVEPDALSISIELISDVSCNGYSNGEVNTTITGGTPPYIYEWDNDEIGNNPSPDNLPAGTWTLTIYDNNGCQISESIVINEPNGVEVIIDEINHVTCFGLSNANVDLHAVGGTSPYEYNWENPPGGNQANVSELSAGTYSLTITDAQNCESIHNIVITEPDSIHFEENILHVDCGESLGEISVDVFGGSMPYQYLWSNESTSPVNGNLIADSYTLIVTDDNNCTHQETFRVDAEGSNDVLISQTEYIACHGDTTAVLTGSMPDGFAEFEYTWSNGIFVQENTNLSAGIYMLSISDSWGCTGMNTYTVAEPTVINTMFVTTSVRCYGDNTGVAILNISGGSGPYTVVWDDDYTGTQHSNLLAGTYYVSVSDHNACQVVDSCTITQPNIPLDASLNITPISCYGLNDGVINAAGVGGTPPYQYYWFSDGHFISEATIRHLSQDVYYLTITDVNDCIIDSTVFISQPTPLEAQYIITNTSCIGNHDGEINFDIEGGTEPYTYTIDNSVFDTIPISDLFQGLYTVSIMDSHGCELVFEDIEIEDTWIDCLRIPNAFTPNGDGANDVWEIGNIDLFPKAFIQVFNRWGQLIYEGKASEGGWDGTYNHVVLPTGPYMYVVNLHSEAEPYVGIVTLIK